MRLLLVFALIVAAATALPTSSWDSFKAKYGKNYASVEEEALRKAIWEKTLAYIEKHNAEAAAGKHSFTLGENKFADMAPQEFRALMNGFRDTGRAKKNVRDFREVASDSIPSTVDWRDEGVVTDIKDQGQCGSCWSFSTTGSVEGQWALSTGNLVSLSEQNLVDCAFIKYDNFACDGGLPDSAFNYIIANNGIDTEASYPYQGTKGTCSYTTTNLGASISSYVDVTSGSESALQKAVATIGPISVGMDASEWAFQLYSSGIYDPTYCSSTELDHAVLVVGYGNSEGTDYWMVKNSWGTSWGIDGYFMLIRNDQNRCGVATTASYPVV